MPELGVYECAPPSWFKGGTHSFVGEGVGVPIRTRGQTLWYSRYICTLWLGITLRFIDEQVPRPNAIFMRRLQKNLESVHLFDI